MYDVERRLVTPIALAGDNLFPTWTKDGDRVTFVSNAGGTYNYYSLRFDGGGSRAALPRG